MIYQVIFSDFKVIRNDFKVIKILSTPYKSTTSYIYICS